MSFITIPYNFVNGTIAQAPQVDANFTAVIDVVNGALDNTNLASGAAIALTKLGLNPGGKAFNQSTTNQITWATGLTTDTQARIQMTTDHGLQFGPGSSTAPDVGLIRSAANTLQIETPSGGAALLDGNGGTLQNFATITLASGGVFNLNGGSISGTSFPVINNGRAYLTSGAPYTDSAASATLYFGPINGNQITLYNGASEVTQTFSQVSLALGALSAGMYDVYCKSASPTTVVLSSVAWSGINTPPTRGTQDGRLTKNGDATNLLIAIIYVTGSAQTADNPAERFISNFYNTSLRSLYCQIPVSSWPYGSATIRPSDANTIDGQGRCSFVNAYAYTTIDATFISMSEPGSATATANGIGLSSTTAYYNSNFAVNNVTTTYSALTTNISAPITTSGLQYIQMLEHLPTGSTATYYGNAASTQGLSWMSGTVIG